MAPKHGPSGSHPAMVVVATMAAALLGACGGGAASPSIGALTEWPDGFVLEYSVVFEAPYADDPYDDPDLPGALLVQERLSLVGPEGTTVGSGELAAIDYREEGITVTCGDDEQSNVEAHDLSDPPGGVTATLEDGTTMTLVPDRQIVVYEAADGYPSCFEQVGAAEVTFVGDAPGVMHGTYRLLDGSLELR